MEFLAVTPKTLQLTKSMKKIFKVWNDVPVGASELAEDAKLPSQFRFFQEKTTTYNHLKENVFIWDRR